MHLPAVAEQKTGDETMGWLLIAVRGLQILSVVLGLFGGGGAVATYESYGDDGTQDGWNILFTIAPMLGAAVAWVASSYLHVTVSSAAVTELVAAGIAMGWTPKSEAAANRLAIACIAVLKELKFLDQVPAIAAAMSGPPTLAVPLAVSSKK